MALIRKSAMGNEAETKLYLSMFYFYFKKIPSMKMQC